MNLNSLHAGALVVAFLLVAVPSLAQQMPSGEAGMLAFNNHCRQCHTYRKDDNRLGPSLYGVVGRKAGGLGSFNNYSEALKRSDVVWTPQQLDQWIEDPDSVIPGNNMASIYPGIKDASVRDSIIGFLTSDRLTETGSLN